MSLPILRGTPTVLPYFANNGQISLFKGQIPIFIEFCKVFSLNHVKFSILSPMKIVITFKARAGLLKRPLEMVIFALSSPFCVSRFSTLPLVAWEGLRSLIVTLPGNIFIFFLLNRFTGQRPIIVILFSFRVIVYQLEMIWMYGLHQSHIGCDRDATCSRPISLQLTGDRWDRNAHIWNEFMIAD